MMTGTRLTRHPKVDGPFPSDDRTPRVFDGDEIAAFGKVQRYNDSVTRYIVRLRDGSECFVNATEQTTEDCAFLRKLARTIRSSQSTSRDAPIVITWLEIAKGAS
jgi:K+/H+ antiporter YhaU regulatory subunit KhtT